MTVPYTGGKILRFAQNDRSLLGMTVYCHAELVEASSFAAFLATVAVPQELLEPYAS